MSSSRSGTGGVRSLVDATSRWCLSSSESSEWRGRMLASRTASAPPPAPTVETDHASEQAREAFLEKLKLKQIAAEQRVQAMQAAGVDEADQDEEEDESEAHDLSASENSDEEDEEDEETEYENELEYFVGEILCLDAINHDAPSGKEVACTYCTEGKKFESEFACSSCAYVRGVCANCRKVVVLRTLEEPSKGAAVCLALLADEALLKETLDLEDAEDVAVVREQITFMLDAFFDKA